MSSEAPARRHGGFYYELPSELCYAAIGRRGIPTNAMLVSIFNDVIGPVMRGPSSSHCARRCGSAAWAREPDGR